jgi:uncharacterized RDD family membrane protein YckC
MSEEFEFDVVPDLPPEPEPGSLAPLWRRGIARIADLVVILLASSAIAGYFGLTEVVDGELVTENPMLVTLVVLVLWAFYEVYGVASGGRTLGKLVMGLRVRQVEADRLPSPFKSLSRWLLPAIAIVLPIGELVLVALVLVYLSAVLNPLRQGFHDRLANTLVVRTR